MWCWCHYTGAPKLVEKLSEHNIEFQFVPINIKNKQANKTPPPKKQAEQIKQPSDKKTKQKSWNSSF